MIYLSLSGRTREGLAIGDREAIIRPNVIYAKVGESGFPLKDLYFWWVFWDVYFHETLHVLLRRLGVRGFSVCRYMSRASKVLNNEFWETISEFSKEFKVFEGG